MKQNHGVQFESNSAPHGSGPKLTQIQSERLAELPDIGDLPGSDVVIFDGSCGFCRRQVQRLHWLARGNLAFLSLHDSRVRELVPELTHDQLMKQMVVVRPDGKYFGGAAAVRYLSRKLPRLWPLCPLLHIPFSLPFWQYCYRRVAENRYQISASQVCGGDSCGIHGIHHHSSD